MSSTGPCYKARQGTQAYDRTSGELIESIDKYYENKLTEDLWVDAVTKTLGDDLVAKHEDLLEVAIPFTDSKAFNYSSDGFRPFALAQSLENHLF